MRYILIVLILCMGCQAQTPTVKEVISADIVVLNNGQKVRYAGLVAPDKPWQKVSRDANAYLVQNKTVFLTPEPKLSHNGILVAYLYTPVVVGKATKYLFVNAEMVRFGFALALPLNPRCEHKDLWQSLWKLQEEEAKPLKRGIWSSLPIKPLPQKEGT